MKNKTKSSDTQKLFSKFSDKSILKNSLEEMNRLLMVIRCESIQINHIHTLFDYFPIYVSKLLRNLLAWIPGKTLANKKTSNLDNK